MKKFKSILCLMLLVLVSCTALAACGRTISYGFDTFSKDIFDGNANLTETKAGIVFNKANSNADYDMSGATYFGEEDKNLDWDKNETTFTFTLDLSAMENWDFTAWVLSFNKKVDETYSHVDEIRFGIIKTTEGYKANEMMGVNHGNDEYATILNNAKNVTTSNNKVKVAITVKADTEKLDYTFTFNDGAKIENSRQVANEIVGFRSLWNAATSCDGIVLSNLEKTK